MGPDPQHWLQLPLQCEAKCFSNKKTPVLKWFINSDGQECTVLTFVLPLLGSILRLFLLLLLHCVPAPERNKTQCSEKHKHPKPKPETRFSARRPPKLRLKLCSMKRRLAKSGIFFPSPKLYSEHKRDTHLFFFRNCRIFREKSAVKLWFRGSEFRPGLQVLA